MLPFLDEIWGNPSSVHHVGRRARALLDSARERAATVLGCKPSEIIFTSGGTESINLAITGTVRSLKSKGCHIVTSAIEHHAVLETCEYLAKNEGFELTRLPVNSDGVVSVESLQQAIRPDTILVSIMAVNNEIGTLQPIAELGSLCRSRGVLFHTDAVQWFGKLPFSNISQFNADLVSICCHKFHGPKGAGILYCRSPLHPDPIQFGGGHENERRAGTENLAAIIGCVEALERFVSEPVFPEKPLRLFTRQIQTFAASVPGVHLVGSESLRLPNTISFAVENTDSMALLAGLDLEGICASSGSACSAGSLLPSHVVLALGFPPALASSLIRFSLGRDSSAEEVNYLESVFSSVIRRSQRAEFAAKNL